MDPAAAVTSGARWELHDGRAESPEAWRRRTALEDRARQLEQLRVRFQKLPPWAQALILVVGALRR